VPLAGLVVLAGLRVAVVEPVERELDRVQLDVHERVVLDPDVLEVVAAGAVLGVLLAAEDLEVDAAVVHLLPEARTVGVVDVDVGDAEVVHDAVGAGRQQVGVDRHHDAVADDAFGGDVGREVVVVRQLDVVDLPVLLVTQHEGSGQAYCRGVLRAVGVERVRHVPVRRDVRPAFATLAVRRDRDRFSLAT
jgi:hypothetical protein